MDISIVTPSFRQLPWLRLSAASVADQKGVEVQHIVQDAGSGPEMGEWAAEQPQIQFFEEKDSGMYDAVNRGLRRATGDVCAYLNCDEQYLPGALASVVGFFRANPNVDILFGDVVLVSAEGKPLSYRRTVLPSLEHVQRVHLNTPTCATFFRRRLLERGFYFDPQWKAIGDMVWMENLLRHKIKMRVLEQPLAVFAFTGDNLGATDVSARESDRWKIQLGIPRQPWRQAGAILSHRVRKFLAGAYRPRRVDIAIFTMSSPGRRQRFVSEGIGFGWPTK